MRGEHRWRPGAPEDIYGEEHECGEIDELMNHKGFFFMFDSMLIDNHDIFFINMFCDILKFI